MQKQYNPSEIEGAAQDHWRAIDAYRAIEHDPRFPKGKFYACSMLPYPSGKLHMGHVRNYAINDVMYRYLRMSGYNVMMPMGWDAFGLPAENAAIDKGVAPSKWTYQNIADMKAQMQPLGLAFDWNRELAACDPAYYKWNQWFFLKMLECGIAYRKTQVVNWDPIDNTVLANEQVIDGRGWRTNALVEKREIPGYYLAISKYADQLLESLKDLGWPERVKIMQENWIGRSVGVRFAFTHQIHDLNATSADATSADASLADASLADARLIDDGRLYVFTTRADTIMGVTFVAVAPEHPLATVAAQQNSQLAAFIEQCKKGGVAEADIATREKEGRPTGLSVSHPLTGEALPVWIGNYVLMSYGDGAVMGVPAHDERDFAFALKYQLPIRPVIDVKGQVYSNTDWQTWYEDKSTGTCIHSGKYDGLGYEAAVDSIAADLQALGLGEKKIQYRLRDWGISRQRYWGTPIPIIHCPEHGATPVPYADLPVRLPDDLVPDGSGNPLNRDERFLKCQCPICGKPSRRETDTMDTFVDSAWYYMRYCSPGSDNAMVDARNDYWMPMDQYIGGIEHAVLHLLYARFWTKVMRDLGLVKFDEPFSNLFTQGMLLNDSYYREDADGKKRWFYPTEVEVRYDDKGRPNGAVVRSDGEPVSLGGIEKMSKSKNNVVEPGAIIAQYGADTARLYSMFAGPPDQSAAWSDSGVEGCFRFLRRLWNYAQALPAHLRAPSAPLDASKLDEPARALRREVHLVLKQAEFDYQRLQYNTVVSAGMKIFNAIEAGDWEGPQGHSLLRESFSILLCVLYPVVPHIGHGLWTELGFEREHGDILDVRWPQVDAQALVQSELELVLQVNGKLRGAVKVAADATREAIEQAVLGSEVFAKYSDGRAAKKIIVVPGRLVNLVF